MTEQERRQSIMLTQDQVEEIANRAADKAIEKITDQIYQQIGRGVLNKLLWILGVVATGLYFWLHDKIHLK